MTRHFIPQLGPEPTSPFPDPAAATHPEGLLAWGGDLHPQRLLHAYRRGIFPWYENPPILWWSPSPRAVLFPDHIHISRRLRRTLRGHACRLSMDEDFAGVIDGCAGPRAEQAGTWITPELRAAFLELHAMGHAHSLEVWNDEQLAGGVYGLGQGKIFFAESKFHRQRDASKIALVALMHALRRWGFLLADCQVWNPHLERMGVRLLSADQFQALLAEGIRRQDLVRCWHDRFARLAISPGELAEAGSAV